MNIKGKPFKFSKGIYRSKKNKKIKINPEFLSICFITFGFGLITGFLFPLSYTSFNLKTSLIFSSIFAIICFLMTFISIKDETYIK